MAKGHLKALDKIRTEKGAKDYNLGTGNGYSVLDLITNFEKVNGVKVNYKIGARRPGDIAACYADPTKAKKTRMGSGKRYRRNVQRCVEVCNKNVINL